MCAVLVALAVGGVFLLASTLGPSHRSPAVAASAKPTPGGLPLYFVKNRGQTDRRARYYMQGKDTSVFFTSKGLAISLGQETGTPAQRLETLRCAGIAGVRRDCAMPPAKEVGRHWGLKLNFLGPHGHPQPVGEAPTPARVSYFKGSRHDWKTGLPTYAQIAYRNVWPGIDLVYAGTQGRLKYSFLVHPGANPNTIHLGWQGASDLRVSPHGELEVSTPLRNLRDEAPVSYQLGGGRRVPVATSYSLGAGHSYGFRIARYDRRRPLVIDPAVLVYAGYLGGSKFDQANNVALDEDKNLYVAGGTLSNDFPATVGPDTTGPDPNKPSDLDDAFVAKLDPNGHLIYAGYIGGSNRDSAINIAVTPSGPDKGAAYLAGSTSSTDFPATSGSFNDTYGGGPQDAFLAKVKPDGTGLQYAGFIGGTGTFGEDQNLPNEQANGVAVDAAGNAYVTGFTASDQTHFPRAGNFQNADNSSIPGYDHVIGNGTGFDPPSPPAPPGHLLDAFALKVDPAGKKFLYGTYLGGGAIDAGTNIAIDPAPPTGTAPSAYVAVYTGSNERPAGPGPPLPGAPNFFGGFPATPSAFDPTFNGSGPAPDDAALIKLNPSGTAVDYGSYIGGAGNEHPFGNAVDANGNVYLTGSTSSDETTFPDGNGFGSPSSRFPGFDQTFNGPVSSDPVTDDPVSDDTFVVKLDKDGAKLLYGTYLGGSGGDEQAIAVAVDDLGSAYVSGHTDSRDGTFPTANGPDSTYNGDANDPADAFAAKLNPQGTALAFSGFIGGALADYGLGMAVDSEHNAYVAGATDSDPCADGFPVHGGPSLTNSGNTDAFVAKIDPTGTATPGPGPSCPAGGASSSPAPPGQLLSDTIAPVISSLTASPKVFAVASGRGARATRRRTRAHATTFSYQLSENATVSFNLQRRTTGRQDSRKSCRKTTRQNRKRRKCVLYVSVGTLAQNGLTGKNKLVFTGRFGRRKLAPGTYRAVVIATDKAGNRSRPREVGFTVVRG